MAGEIDQLPGICQPLVCPPLSSAFIQVDCLPAKEEVKVIAKFNVRVLPDPEAEELLPFTLHWLFCRVPAVPGFSGPCQLVPASLIRYTLFVDRT